ncbi:hypothetical protein [Streptococcus oriscaviae]|uniref:Lipoprotein n=1 Tax=Streptococcus oriscaviae TaxID=2781599 RepID=A0ABX7YJB5_9STRE|nr:hypothetical protein [Streptococcus oriscaviae]QUE53908.1 hypothetical protein INT76_08755 [Streptococcus oriscaviae]HEL1008724.1 hypothetical protein [Streptococcus equi subsp. zooepidemicus]
MNMMKRMSCMVVLFASGVLMVACGNQANNGVGDKNNETVDIGEAVKSEKKVIDGKEVEEYVLKDGTIIQQDVEAAKELEQGE